MTTLTNEIPGLRGSTTGGVARRRTRIRRALHSPVAYLFVAPALVIFLVWTIGPTIYTFWVSMFDWNRLNPKLSTFTGPQNYIDMMRGTTNPPFWDTARISLYFVVGNVVGGTIISLILALLVRKATTLMVAARTSFFLAYFAPAVATSMMWTWIFNPRYGLANAVLQAFHLPTIDWLGDSRYAMISILIYSLWHEVGFLVLVFIGGLLTTSKDLSEAAKIDGANGWKEFWYVTFPQLIPFIAFVVVISSISSLQAFTQFFVMTGGGPGNATATIGFQLYQQSFVFGNTGYAAALAVVLFLITLALSIVQLKVSGRLSR